MTIMVLEGKAVVVTFALWAMFSLLPFHEQLTCSEKHSKKLVDYWLFSRKQYCTVQGLAADHNIRNVFNQRSLHKNASVENVGSKYIN